MRPFFLSGALHVLFHPAIAEMELFAGLVFGKNEIYAERLGAQFIFGVVYLNLYIYYVAPYAGNRGVERDIVIRGVYGLQVTHLHARGYAACLKLAEYDPTADLVGKRGLNASVQSVDPPLKFGAWLPTADYAVSVLVKLHSQSLFTVRIASETAVSLHSPPRIYDFFHYGIVLCRGHGIIKAIMADVGCIFCKYMNSG